MKRIAAISLLCVTLWGCDKDILPVVPPPVEQPVVPTVSLSISPILGGVLPYGSTVTVSWTTTNAKSVTLNSQPVGISDSKTERLFESTTYILNAVNGTLSKGDQKSVTVGDWTTSNTGLLVGKQWNGLLSMQTYTDGALVSDPQLQEGQVNNPLYFTLEGEVRSPTKGKTCDWSFQNGEKTLIMGRTYTLVALSKTRLVLSEPVTYNSKPSIYVLTYWRAE